MILNEPFNKELLNNFLKDFLPDYHLDERSVRTPDKSILTEVTHLGASRKAEVTVLEAECEETDTNRRIAITQAAFKVLRDHSIRNAIIAFHDGADQWRLSLLTSTLEIKDGKVIKKDSNPRRYSYLLGVGAKTVTPYKYLIEKGKVEDIKQLQERFSVEVVNKQFYASVADLFTKLVGGERGATKYPGLLKINSVVSQNVEHQEFAVRLIGRVIFSWFLKEKKSTAGVAIVPNELLSLDAVASNADYYHSILEPLFFELLNKRVENRHESLREAPFSTVPYLNGGLFSPQRGDFYSQNSFNGVGTPGLTHIPNEWFSELFTVLEQYNFTVDENTSYDVDLSIDPEMLGRIFENLLAEINPETGESARKSTGSFYTPREIVDYMVDSSLLEFLKTKTGTDEKKLKALISWGQTDDDEHPLTDSERQKVVNSLAGLTILDPACGSGAFPIGILQKVVYILQQADPRAEVWLENQLKGISSPELKRDIQEKYESENYDWLRKYGVIRETIFGIDIQTIATEISKLRCFLTLIIEETVDDEKPNRGIHALPNLDFKFVTANSLIGLPESNVSNKGKVLNLFEDVSHIEQLKSIRNQYFGANADERARLQVEFKNLQMDMLRSRIASSNSTSDLYNELSDWDPFSHKATGWFDAEWMFGLKSFDIVIANPPYVSTEKIQEPDKTNYKNEYIEVHVGRTDVYTYFYKRGLDLAKAGDGILCFITNNSWMRAAYGVKLRKFFAAKDPVTLIDFGGKKIFDSATVDTNILIVHNRPNRGVFNGVQIDESMMHHSSLDATYETNKVPIKGISDDVWYIGTAADMSLKRKIEHLGVTLDCWDLNISRGIISGLNEAFIISGSIKNDLIKQDSRSSEIIKPLVRGRDIKKFNFQHNDLYIIAVGFGMYKELADSYPAIQKWLQAFEAKLKKRGQCRSSRSGKKMSDDYEGQHHWLELDNNLSREYLNRFENQKIAWSDLSDSGRFSLVDEGYYIDKTAFFMDAHDPHYLLGVLNSRLIGYYFDKVCSSSGVGTNLWSKVSLVKIPVRKPESEPSISEKIRQKVIDLSNSSDTEALKELDQLVYQLYNLTPEEIAIVEGS